MKHKRLDRDEWGFEGFPYFQIRVNTDFFHGIVCVIHILSGEYQYWESKTEGKLCVCGEGMKWLQLIPDNTNRLITAMFFKDGMHEKSRVNYPEVEDEKHQVSVWYVDVTEGYEYANDGVIVYTDKYLDVIFTPEKEVTIDDRDELDLAYSNGELTSEQYEAALRECELIQKDLTNDIDKTHRLCVKILDYIEEKIANNEVVNLKAIKEETKKIMQLGDWLDFAIDFFSQDDFYKEDKLCVEEDRNKSISALCELRFRFILWKKNKGIEEFETKYADYIELVDLLTDNKNNKIWKSWMKYFVFLGRSEWSMLWEAVDAALEKNIFLEE